MTKPENEKIIHRLRPNTSLDMSQDVRRDMSQRRIFPSVSQAMLLGCVLLVAVGSRAADSPLSAEGEGAGDLRGLASTVGDRVWIDLDGDGLQGPDEMGRDGVTVRLLDSGLVEVGVQVTSGGGYYMFSPDPGTYVLDFGLPPGFAWTLQDVGSDNGLDSDVDPSTSRTGAFLVGSGTSDLSWDAGIQPVAELSIAKTGAPNPVGGDELLVYQLTVFNAGPGAASEVLVTDELPAVTSWEGDSCGAGLPEGSTWSWLIGSLEPGMEASCELTVRVDADVEEGFTNTAVVSSASPDIDPSDNVSSWTSRIRTADLVLSVAPGVEGVRGAVSVENGAVVELDIRVENLGPDEAQGLDLSSSFGRAFEWAGESCAGASGPETWSYSLERLAPGTSFQCLVDLRAVAVGDHVVATQVAGRGVDPNPADNEVNLAISVVGAGSIVEVPTLDDLGLLLLSVLLAFAGTAALARRRPESSAGVKPRRT